MIINTIKACRIIAALFVLIGALSLCRAMPDADFVTAMKSTDAAARLAALNQAAGDVLTVERVKALADVIAQDADPKVREKAAEQLRAMANAPALFPALSYLAPRLQQGMLKADNTAPLCSYLDAMLTGDPTIEADYRLAWLSAADPQVNKLGTAQFYTTNT